MGLSLPLNLGARSYPIHFGDDLTASVAAQVAALAAEGRRVAIVTDANVAAAQAAALRAMFGDAPVLTVAAGEGSKSLETLGRVLDFLSEKKLGRSDALFASGGGVIGDLAGFAAASYLRGIA